jgi:hypothetical protein
MKHFVLFAFISFIGIGCGTPRIMSEREYQERPQIQTSLFRGDQDFVSEDAVQKILSSKIQFRSKVKVAIFKYDGSEEEHFAITNYGYYYWRSEAYIKLQQRLLDTLQSLLLSSGRVSEATVLPSMLVPKQPTITMLRQAAVRLQADVLLVFRITSDVYYDVLLFEKDKIKAYSTCEVLFFDTRTGIIPFTTVASRDLLTRRLSEEIDKQEAMKRAQEEASLQAIAAVGNEVAGFFKQVQ